MRGMLRMLDLKAQDLHGLSAAELTALAAQMLEHIQHQAHEIDSKGRELELKHQLIERKDRDIAWRDAKIEKINFELARLKRWKFGAKTEAMTADQRQMFQDTLLEDEADLEAQLAALQAALPNKAPAAPKAPPRRPRRQALPEHLRRVEHRHEPEDTACSTPDCGQPMTRIGEDVSERLDIVPAEFFVHRHIYGKWTCRCCQRQGIERLVQEPADPQIIDGGIAASGLVAHTLISRFVDHMPYYRQEAVNARSGVHTPRSTLASQSGRAGAAMEPLFDAQRDFVLSCPVLQADETPVAMLDPGAGKTKRAYIWAYARGELDDQPGVIYEFCPCRGAQYPLAFLGASQGPPGSRDHRPAWNGTLVCDQYAGYDRALDRRVFPQRLAARCAAHARRKFDELAGTSEVAREAIKRIGWIYHVEGQFAQMDASQRQAARHQLTRPLWNELQVWLKLERTRVPDGGAIAGAIDYSLNSWVALTRHLDDGAVPIDNNFIERQIKPWAMGRKAWLFCGSEMAGQRAAVVMSLVQSAKLNGHEPWAYLRDVLERLPGHPNSRIDELLPHRWRPAAASTAIA